MIIFQSLGSPSDCHRPRISPVSTVAVPNPLLVPKAPNAGLPALSLLMYLPCARHWPGVLFAEYMIRTAQRCRNDRPDPCGEPVPFRADRRDHPAYRMTVLSAVDQARASPFPPLGARFGRILNSSSSVLF